MTKQKLVKPTTETQEEVAKEQDKMAESNYEGLECLSWLASDTLNLQNWASAVFRGGMLLSDPGFISLINAANKSIKETEDDISKIKEFLAQYGSN